MESRTRRTLKRRLFTSPGPMFTIHVDGNEKQLHPLGITIHLGVDGFSRKAIYMMVALNKRANTVKVCCVYYAGACLCHVFASCAYVCECACVRVYVCMHLYSSVTCIVYVFLRMTENKCAQLQCSLRNSLSSRWLLIKRLRCLGGGGICALIMAGR